jgi:hypothetical protein
MSMREVREVHTHSDSGGGTAAGMLLGIVLVLLVLAVAAFVFFGNGFATFGGGATNRGTGDTNIQVNPPSAPPKVDVNVNTPSQGGGGSQQAPTTKP